MPSTYLPSREADLDVWLENFSALIAAGPSSYGLTDEDAEEIAVAVEAWHSAFTIATSPATRTQPAVATKNRARAAALIIVRRYAASIRADSSLSAALKINLGLQPPPPALTGGPAPAPIPAPATYPVLSFTAMRPGMQRLRIADAATPNKRARPRGTVGLLLFRAVGAEPARNPAEAAFLALVTRAEFESVFTPADHGQTATYFARWTNHKGEPGPWSPPAVMPIAA